MNVWIGLLAFCGLLSTLASTSALSTSTPNNGNAAPASITIPIVICPGFGNDAIDYSEPLQQPREVGFVSALERRGCDPRSISVLDIQRSDWIRVAGGLFDIPNFYTNTAQPTGNGYGWYVKKLTECITEAHAAGGDQKVLLIGHSAGGWLARAAIADEKVRDKVACLTTLGAIHRPPEDAGSCVTRGALAYTDREYPGAFLRDRGVGYVSVGGDAITGDDTRQQTIASDADDVYSARGEGSSGRVAFTSYEAVCGRGDVTGDGVVPLEWTQLEGAVQIRLPGVIHSINEAGTTLPTDRWYGSEDVIDQWLPAALAEAGVTVEEEKGGLLNDLWKMISN